MYNSDQLFQENINVSNLIMSDNIDDAVKLLGTFNDEQLESSLSSCKHLLESKKYARHLSTAQRLCLQFKTKAIQQILSSRETSI